jgi:hypothetical protein
MSRAPMGPLPSNGGGLDAVGATVTLNNVTIAENSASNGGGVNSTALNGSGPATIKANNSIIAENAATSSAPDCAGGLESLGFNLIGDTTGCSFTGDTKTDITGRDPELGPLSIHDSCMTETLAPQAGSPALKTGNLGIPNGINGHCLPKDQCGTPREAGDCDIGAVQVSR